MKKLFAALLICLVSCPTVSFAAERECFDDGWKFTFGNAADPAKDFGCGTEYFNYLTKANSIHNEGPYSNKFDPAKWDNEWIDVTLPHDWVVDLPFAPEASHSHGYKTVGYKYPETSVGWYRKTFDIPEDDFGKHISLQFDGIFRDARVWVNGFYLGSEPSGYATQVYDISEYLNYGGDNIVAVRDDATLEEGWFYEGAGIYRHVWLDKADPLHVAPFGIFIHAELEEPYDAAVVTVETTVDNKSLDSGTYTVRNTLISPDGIKTVFPEIVEKGLMAKDSRTSVVKTTIENPALWDLDSPNLYTLVTDIVRDGLVVDTKATKTGFRHINFDADKGFFLNGRNVKLKGVNLHQDHAGVGAAIPDALQAFRLRELKKYGVNAYRASHNPMTPAMIDACDSLGILVMEENRLTGVNDEHIRLLRRMIERDRNHPSIIAWSIGNEEWGTEWNDFGKRISESMREYCHRFDPTRPMSMASAGGPTVLVPVDVAGYNYILQNPIERLREEYPARKAVGTEETTGCGARGVYFDDHANGYMKAINRVPNGPDSLYNAIERGWKFYDERPWLSGLFYWTGFDYRGEPNPMTYPATGSQFGILDYCGFPKDEAFYLKSWWTDDPVLHIFPHWNLQGHEGEEIDVWAYSNMDEVELFVNGRSLGRKSMPKNGHLSWKAVYRPGNVKAVGYKKGKKAMETKIETTGEPARLRLAADRAVVKADNVDVAVVTVSVIDNKGRFVPDANIPLNITVEGPARILGAGNGDPAFRGAERPTDGLRKAFAVNTFNGLAQILLQTENTPGDITLTVNGQELTLKATGATPAASLLSLLKQTVDEGKTYFGHHDATVYGHTWMGDSCRSDVRDVVGRFPGLVSWDISNIDWGVGRNLEQRVRREVVAHHRRGGINTFCWHALHPITGATPWQVEDTTLVWQIVHTPEGRKAYADQLDRICDFFDSLVDDRGNKIPVVFRPWHEHTGSWFWWGRGNCSVDDYVALWTIMRRHFDRRGVDNVVWAYSPDRCKTVDDYMERYPGDEFVDIMGADVYHFDGYDGVDEFVLCASRTLDAAIAEARKRDKVAAFTETGLESLTVPDWYTAVLRPLLRKCPVAYVIVWRNAFNSPTHFYAPYPGHPSEQSFREFASDPAMIFVD